MSRKLVDLQVTDRGAVYINGTRVSGRHTKWGVHTTVFSVRTPSKLVRQILYDNGYGHIKLEDGW